MLPLKTSKLKKVNTDQCLICSLDLNNSNSNNAALEEEVLFVTQDIAASVPNPACPPLPLHCLPLLLLNFFLLSLLFLLKLDLIIFYSLFFLLMNATSTPPLLCPFSH